MCQRLWVARGGWCRSMGSNCLLHVPYALTTPALQPPDSPCLSMVGQKLNTFLLITLSLLSLHGCSWSSCIPRNKFSGAKEWWEDFCSSPLHPRHIHAEDHFGIQSHLTVSAPTSTLPRILQKTIFWIETSFIAWITWSIFFLFPIFLDVFSKSNS